MSRFCASLANAMAECHGAVRPTKRDETRGAQPGQIDAAGARSARRPGRRRTNKIIGQKLGISPRTVELHRAQVMNRLNASSLTELLQIALAAGITPSAPGAGERQKASSRKSAASVC